MTSAQRERLVTVCSVVTVGILLVYVALTIGIGVSKMYKESKPYDFSIQSFTLPLRMDVNYAIMRDGLERYLPFFNKFTLSEEISYYLVTEAVAKDVPVNWLIALAMAKTKVDPDYKVDGNIGMFALPRSIWGDKATFSVEESVAVVTEFVNKLYKFHKNWDYVQIVYTSGSLDRVTKYGLKEYVLFRNYEEALDVGFASFR